MSREQQLEHFMKNHTENLLRIAYYYTKNAQSAFSGRRAARHIANVASRVDTVEV